METVENNKLIAKFMGWNERVLPVSLGGARCWITYCGKTGSYGCEVGKEHFHNDWAWLMPVISVIKDNSLEEYHLIDIIDDALTDVSIRGTYDAVVEFIKWYNKQFKNK